MIRKAEWIRIDSTSDNLCPKYRKTFDLSKEIQNAKLYITAQGVYEAHINGNRVGEYIFAPGWTAYEKRLQYQIYDVTDMLTIENVLEITVANGWYRFGADYLLKKMMERKGLSVIAFLHITYSDQTEEFVQTDNTWTASESKLVFSDLYDGLLYDANAVMNFKPVCTMDIPKDILTQQQGEMICEHERIKPLDIFKTPKGETVVDFGQNITGYVEFAVNAQKGDRVKISHAEILDSDGNFYNANYRSAKALIEYVCKDGHQIFKPTHNFYGFRYIRLDEFPETATADNFTAVVVHSQLKRTGYISTGVPEVNKLFENIIWGQKDNFLDIPTDCPQRDERLGWTGDAAAFVKTASYNFDVEKFFDKWLNDVRLEQCENGRIPNVVPDAFGGETSSAAWGDAAVICPWQIYMTYGNIGVLKDNFECMKGWVDYITNTTSQPNLWIGGTHFGDWLGIDAPFGSYKGSSDEDFIASAFYANSVSLVVKAGKALGEDVSYYEALYANIVSEFKKTYTTYTTQTEHVLAISFGLTDNKQAVGDSLNRMINDNGCKLTTGFVGTPRLLHALSATGHTDMAYSLLLQTEYPSWLFSVKMGATTIWEHWDGIREDGTMWPSDMNSYNHYSYGSVADWIYEVAAGIQPVEDSPGFERIRISPNPDRRLGHLDVIIDTVCGIVRSFWVYQPDGKIRYEITVPSQATVIINNKETVCQKGSYVFYTNS